MRALLGLLGAVNPAAVGVALAGRYERIVVAVGAVVGTLVAVALAAGSDGVLDALDVTPETFRVAAGIVLALTGARWLVLGGRPLAVETDGGGWGALVVPVLLPVLVTPALAMVALSAGADDGTGAVAVGAAVSMAAAVAMTAGGRRGALGDAGVRFFGALGIAVALGLVVDGVQAI